MDCLCSRPCAGATSKEEASQRMQVLYSDNWPQDLRVVMKNLKEFQEWQVVSHCGRSFRFGASGELSAIPEPFEFPLILQPLSEQELMKDLEMFKLEEALLEEQMLLLELEAQQSAVDAVVPSSSKNTSLSNLVGHLLKCALITSHNHT